MKLDFLKPADLPYPGGQATVSCAGGNAVVVTAGMNAYQAPSRDGFFNSIFTPDDLPYPLPASMPTAPVNGSSPTCVCTCGAATTGPTSPPNGSTSGVTSPAPSNPPPASSSPVSSTPISPASVGGSASTPTAPGQIIINVGVPAASAPVDGASGPASSSSNAATTQGSAVSTTGTGTSTATVPAAQTTAATAGATATGASDPSQPAPMCMPSDVLVQAYVLNPRLRSRTPRAQEQLIETMIDENITGRMLSANSAPVAFVVPDGCNTVEFFTKAPEINPGRGDEFDQELVITTGAPKLTTSCNTNNGALRSGDQITVTLPWRYAPYVELAPDRLRVSVTARFWYAPTIQPL